MIRIPDDYRNSYLALQPSISKDKPIYLQSVAVTVCLQAVYQSTFSYMEIRERKKKNNTWFLCQIDVKDYTAAVS